MSDKVSDKTEYEKAKEKIDEQEHTELYNAGTMNSEQYRAIIREYAMTREALALAEGERRGYAKAQTDITNGDYKLCFTTDDIKKAIADAKKEERERIEGIIAQMEKEYTAKMIGIPHAPDFMAALSELKSAIAEE